MSGAQGPRGPGVLYSGLSVALVVAFALVLVTVPHDPPPTIAEISPQAVAQIEEPPPEQAVDLDDEEPDQSEQDATDQSDATGEGDAATGDGGSDGSGQDGDTGESPDGGDDGGEGGDPDADLDDGDPIFDEGARNESPTTRICIKGPDGRLRQTEDPQSPPCVAFWDRTNNGGETYHGVTETEIRVAVPSLSDDHPYLLAYEQYFNARFEFYGRQLRLIGLHDPARPAGAPAEQIQRAEEVVAEHDVFASTSGFEHGGVYYGKRLAELERMYAVALGNWTEDTLRTPLGEPSRYGPGLHPFVWQYEMGWDRQFAAAAGYACDRLAGQPPRWADELGGLPIGAEPPDARRFGIIYNDVYGPYTVNADEVATMLSPCQGGSDSEVPVKLIKVEDTGSLQEQQYADAVAHMRSRGVTTIVCLCNAQVYVSLTRLAPVDYRPEWFLSGYSLNQMLVTKRGPEQLSADRDHLRNSFGFSAVPRHVNAADDPSLQALLEGNSRVWSSGSDVSAQRENALHLVYRSLLVLSSGIQMAGPQLTPETFERGLQNADFPNPEHPINAGRVHFLGGSRTMTLDLVEYYWGDGDNGPYVGDPNGLGAWCYLDGGRRFVIGEWPDTEPGFFPDTTCDSGRRARGG